MAAAPKPVEKLPPLDEPEIETDEAPAPPKRSKKRLLWILIILLVIGGASGGAWYFLNHKKETPTPAAEANGETPAAADTAAPAADAAAVKETAAVKIDPSKPPVFVVLEPFTVNLQTETTEQFLQAGVTLQVPDQAQQELIKLYMPQIRSRLLLLLSSKKPSEISTVEGKKKLSEEIIAQVQEPFSEQGPAQQVANVFFTSFVIQ